MIIMPYKDEAKAKEVRLAHSKKHKEEHGYKYWNYANSPIWMTPPERMARVDKYVAEITEKLNARGVEPDAKRRNSITQRIFVLRNMCKGHVQKLHDDGYKHYNPVIP